MHNGLNMQSFMPEYLIVKSTKDSDPKTAWELYASLKAGEICVFDWAYVDFKHLNHLHERRVFWVTRTKENMLYEVMGQHAVTTQAADCDVTPKVMEQHRYGKLKKASKRKYVRKKLRVISDEKIRLTGSKTPVYYPQE